MERAGRTKRTYVIAAIIVAAAVIGSTVFYMWASSFFEQGKPATTEIKGRITEHPDGYIINITYMDHYKSYWEWRWRLKDINGSVINDGYNLGDAMGVNLDYRNESGEPIGFISVDSYRKDGKYLRPKDRIFIHKELIPDNINGVSFELIFNPTGNVIKKFRLDNAIWNPSPMPTKQTTINTWSHNDTNLTFKSEQMLSHYIVYFVFVKGNQEITITVINQGNQSYNNISICSGYDINCDQYGNPWNDEYYFIPQNSTLTISKHFTLRDYKIYTLYITIFSKDFGQLISCEIQFFGVRIFVSAPSFSLSFSALVLTMILHISLQTYLSSRRLD